MNQTTLNICQFVAAYFGDEHEVDYSKLGRGDTDWCGYVEIIAEAAEAFEEAADGARFDDYYGLLEEACESLAEELTFDVGPLPDHNALVLLFEGTINEHLKAQEAAYKTRLPEGGAS